MHEETPRSQGELPLGLDISVANTMSAQTRRGALIAFLASNRRQMLTMALAGACLLWGSWATHQLLGLEQRVTVIRKVALADLVREYVQGEARTGAAPEQITAQTGAYLKALNFAVARHAARGEVLLLSNAVVAGDVPDITPAIRDEVYASLTKPQTVAPANAPQSPTAQMEQFFQSKGASKGSGK